MTADRREVFRTAMQRLRPTDDPAQAIAAGWYVEPARAISTRIVAALDLDPASSHLVMGAIGSGKTTELVRVRERLNATAQDIEAIVVDVPAVHRISKLTPGVLVAIAALEIAERVQLDDIPAGDREVLKGYIRSINTTAYGYRAPNPNDYDEPDGEFQPGVLESPTPDWQAARLADATAPLLPHLARKPVLLYDGLDRLTDTRAFADMIATDLALLGELSIGCVIVGPQELRFRSEFSVRNRFSEVHLHRPGTADDEAGRAFLTRVLTERMDEQVLPREAAARIAAHCGGVVRDLIWLARAAVQEAYATGADAVEPRHVDVAVDRFGSNLLLGITGEMADRLVALRRQPAVLPPLSMALQTLATDTDIQLLMDRLLVELPGDPPQYVPHPAIVPLIPGLARRSA